MSTAALPRTPALTPRRRRLLDAAVTVVGTAGLRGLTHRAVDREAGMPEGTASVSYRTRLALLSALTERIGDQLAQEVADLSAALPDRRDGEETPLEPVIEGATGLLASWVAEPHRLVCMVELTMETVRTPALRPAFERWRTRLVDLVEDLVSRKVRTQVQPRVHAEAVVAALEGVLTSALSQPPERREEYLRTTVAVLLRAMAPPPERGARG